MSAKDCGSSCQMEYSCKDCLWTCFGTEGDIFEGDDDWINWRI